MAGTTEDTVPSIALNTPPKSSFPDANFVLEGLRQSKSLTISPTFILAFSRSSNF